MSKLFSSRIDFEPGKPSNNSAENIDIESKKDSDQIVLELRNLIMKETVKINKKINIRNEKVAQR